MNKIEILRFLSYSCVAGLFVYAWQTVGTKKKNEKKLEDYKKEICILNQQNKFLTKKINEVSRENVLLRRTASKEKKKNYGIDYEM